MFKYIIGIDEVGRGPLAGPVTVAAVAATVNLKFRIKNLELNLRKSDFQKLTINNSDRKSDFPILKDSKRLTPKQREIWFNCIKKHPKIFYAIASVSPKVIDRINISNAANLAAARALNKLLATSHLGLATRKNIFLDGGLYIKTKTLMANGYTLNPRTIIKGDEKIPAISLASIVAKVTRDRMMRKLHKKYPKYGFDRHKGYGTKKHFKMIRKYGLSPIHRKSFNSKKRIGFGF